MRDEESKLIIPYFSYHIPFPSFLIPRSSLLIGPGQSPGVTRLRVVRRVLPGNEGIPVLPGTKGGPGGGFPPRPQNQDRSIFPAPHLCRRVFPFRPPSLPHRANHR